MGLFYLMACEPWRLYVVSSAVALRCSSEWLLITIVQPISQGGDPYLCRFCQAQFIFRLIRNKGWGGFDTAADLYHSSFEDTFCSVRSRLREGVRT